MPAHAAIMVILACLLQAGAGRQLPFVIPAQAGIQWLKQSIPALAGMPFGAAGLVYHPGLSSWIPAFAGMTTKR